MKNILSLLLSLTFVAWLSSCNKDNDYPDGIDQYLPSSQIIASESLVIPDAVAVPAHLPGGTTRVATYYASGVQRYIAKPKVGAPSSFEWTFVAPEAELFDVSNQKVGKHGAGPYWCISAADSIFAQQYTPVKSAPAAYAQSIDWLLLKPKTGTTPTGIFSDVQYVQRIATKGGKAPLTAPANAGDTVSVHYTAIYRFTKLKP